ncbi:MAG TPA: hypothetical protein DCY88_28765 [Cyanobacteria bacterium UBA11372]|nr:hypothetical protein [Cyanobacteria bacterium UBA11372]
MKNYWSTHTLSPNSPLLKKIGGRPGDYEIMWDRQAGVLRIQEQSSGQQWQIPLSSPNDVMQLLTLGGKTRDDLNQSEVKLLKQLSDARYSKGWTKWKQSNYEVQTKTDSTGFVKDIYIKKAGTNADHIHIYTDTVTGEKGTNLTVVRNGKSEHYKIDGNKSVDELINEFTP